LAVIAISALFAGAFRFQTEWWSIASVTLTLALLLGGTVGLSLKLCQRAFWLPFCIVGWVCFGIVFASTELTTLRLNLPSTKLAFQIWASADKELELKLAQSLQWSDVMGINLYRVYNVDMVGTGATAFSQDEYASYRVFHNIFQSLSILVVSAGAGVIASFAAGRHRQRTLSAKLNAV
jgi:hypothetical protein